MSLRSLQNVLRGQAMTGTSTRASDFFVAGGTLDSDSPSYVKRPADDDLFNLALAGEFCFVLTPRQMGKSSLMIRTAHRLAGQGVRTAIIDLTGIGTDVSAEQWYLGLITRLKVQMKLCVDPDSWWGERASLSPVQRFLDFLRDVVLAEIEGPVVIFVDEIDTTLNLDFSDDFFAAIRFTYNARAVDSAYYRLTFVLLGVAAPADLIKDPSQTPFNIGHGIDLHEFDLEDAKVLQQGLETVCPKQQARAIFSRIFYWTNGHPYLTQKLCLGAAERESEYWADANVQVDGLVEALFLSDEARKESNLQFVRDRILTYPQRRRLLALYRRVYRGGRVADDKRSLVQNQLKLSGLVRAEDRRLHIRNEIYRRAFDLVWVRENTAIDWAPIFLGIIVFGITLGVGIFVYNGWVGNQLRDCIASFYQTDVPTERLTHLARMFKLRSVGWGPTDHDYRARELFYGLPREGQLHLLNAPDVQDRDLTEVIRGLYVTLADVDGTGGTTPVLEAMAAALSRLDDTTEETANLTNEIDNWLQGREFITKNQYDDALVKYNRAIESNGENPSTLFERARVLAELSDYEQALSDFDRVMAIAGKAPNPTPVPSPSPVPTPSLLAAPGASPSLAITSTSTLGKETPTVQTPSPSESASLIAASPIASVTAVPITSPTPTETAAPTAAAEPVSIASEFMTFGQIVRAVRNLIYDNPYLISTLARVPHTQYANLREFGLAPTPTSTIMPTNTPTRDYPWDVRTATTTITRPPPTPTPTVAPTTALIPRTLVSHFFPAAPGIDGDLSEWDMFTDVVLDAMTAESIRGLVSSSEDASAILRSGWDDNFLYFALEIRDDLLVADSEEIWRDDSVELGLDGLFDHVGRQEDDHQFILNLDGRVVDFGRDTTAVTAITRTLSGGWAMEIAIAAEGIGAGALAAGKEMGFTFGLHDDDDGGDWDSYLVWEGDSTNNSSAEYGRLLLSDEAVGPIPTATNTSAVVNTLIVTPTPTSTPDERRRFTTLSSLVIRCVTSPCSSASPWRP
ncbi:MAG: AAA-like domain-containing protein [Chloroflexi bacterium]|nr:AAA-like domain-containing protein [Chloroflexota bacterium]